MESTEYFEAKIYLSYEDNLNSKLSNELYNLKFIFKDERNFEIEAKEEKYEETYFLNLSIADYINKEEKEFIKKINNFGLLYNSIKKAIDKKRVTLTKNNGILKLTLFYTIIFDDFTISFPIPKVIIEETPGDSEEIEEPELVTKSNIDFKAEIVKYDKQFIDYWYKDIIKVTIKNVGTCTWPRGETSFVCVPDFSTLLCEEYIILDDDVIPGDEVTIKLEFLKKQEKKFEKPYFTFIRLHIHPQFFEPMLLLDFNDAFNAEKKIASEKDIDEYNNTKITKIKKTMDYFKKYFLVPKVMLFLDKNNNNQNSNNKKNLINNIINNANQNEIKNNNNEMNNMKNNNDDNKKKENL